MKWLRLWLPVVVWAGLIFYLSGIPDLKTNLRYDFLLRKLAHIFEYFILAMLAYRAFAGSFDLKALGGFALPADFCLLYAISDELHQRFVPGRSCSAKDILIDSLGILFFYILLKFKYKRLQQNPGA